MNWLSFFIGALVGWIVEWIIDLFYWRRRYYGAAEAETELRAQLSRAEGELKTLRMQLEENKDIEQQLAACRGDLKNRVAQVEQLDADLSALRAEVDELRNQLSDVNVEKETLLSRLDEFTRGAPEVAAVAPTIAAAAFAAAGAEAISEDRTMVEDDLTIIEGIGPAITDLLNGNGIRTFVQLADAKVDDLRAILQAGGSRFQMADPESWPRQARLAANRDWVKLAALKEQLVGGVRRPAAETEPTAEDDLTVIEGIGPKISVLLKQQGIRTFGQLAKTDMSRMQEILDQAGPNFRLADPTTWPEQAGLAADAAWEKLHTFQDRLKAGRNAS